MTHNLRPGPARPNLTILLLADSPSFEQRADFETPVARREAIISVARATFAVGGTVVVPLDVDVAPLLGTLALDYLQPRAAELRGEPVPVPRVTVMETQSASAPARRLLAPLAARGALRIVDVEGRAVDLDASTEEEIEGLSDVVRHRVTRGMVSLVRPTFAVLIRPGRRVIEEVGVLRARDVPIFSFGLEDAEDRPSELGVIDPTESFLSDTTRSPWVEDAPHTETYPVPPYAYLIQRLIAEQPDR